MGSPFWIRASEIQAYRYCARGWWLQFVLGLEPADQYRLAEGTERHRRVGRRVVRSERARRQGLWLLLIALFLAALAILLLSRGG